MDPKTAWTGQPSGPERGLYGASRRAGRKGCTNFHCFFIEINLRICTLPDPPPRYFLPVPVIETEGMVEQRDLYKISMFLFRDESENLYTPCPYFLPAPVVETEGMVEHRDLYKF